MHGEVMMHDEHETSGDGRVPEGLSQRLLTIIDLCCIERVDVQCGEVSAAAVQGLGLTRRRDQRDESGLVKRYGNRV